MRRFLSQVERFIRGRRSGKKMWGRPEKARLVGWMEKGLWRGVGVGGGGWRWN